jgi:hypothetical protein
MRFTVKPIEPKDRACAKKPQTGHKNQRYDYFRHACVTKPEPIAQPPEGHWLALDANKAGRM